MCGREREREERDEIIIKYQLKILMAIMLLSAKLIVARRYKNVCVHKKY